MPNPPRQSRKSEHDERDDVERRPVRLVDPARRIRHFLSVLQLCVPAGRFLRFCFPRHGISHRMAPWATDGEQLSDALQSAVLALNEPPVHARNSANWRPQRFAAALPSP